MRCVNFSSGRTATTKVLPGVLHAEGSLKEATTTVTNGQQKHTLGATGMAQLEMQI